MAELKQKLDENQKPLDDYEVIINFQDEDADGKPQQLALSPLKTIQRMKEVDEKYGNLFIDPSAGGTGLLTKKPNPKKGKLESKDFQKMSLKEYEQAKEDGLV